MALRRLLSLRYVDGAVTALLIAAMPCTARAAPAQGGVAQARVLAEARPVVVVTSSSVEAPQWTARVRSQLIDLDAVQVRADTERPIEGQVMWAELIADASTDPRASVCPGAGGTMLLVRWADGTRGPYCARVAASWAKLPSAERSVAYEAAALALRSAVRATLLGLSAAPSSEPEREVVESTLPAPAPPPAQSIPFESVVPAAPANPPRRSAPAPARSTELLGGLGVSLDGQTPLWSPVFVVGGRRCVEPWCFTATVWGRPIASASLPGAELALPRLGVDVDISRIFAKQGGFCASALLQLGGVAEWRRTRVTDATVVATPDSRHLGLWTGGGFSGAWRFGDRQSLELRGVVGHAFPSTRYALRGATTPVAHRADAAMVQARAAATWAWSW